VSGGAREIGLGSSIGIQDLASDWPRVVEFDAELARLRWCLKARRTGFFLTGKVVSICSQILLKSSIKTALH